MKVSMILFVLSEFLMKNVNEFIIIKVENNIIDPVYVRTVKTNKLVIDKPLITINTIYPYNKSPKPLNSILDMHVFNIISFGCNKKLSNSADIIRLDNSLTFPNNMPVMPVIDFISAINISVSESL